MAPHMRLPNHSQFALRLVSPKDADTEVRSFLLFCYPGTASTGSLQNRKSMHLLPVIVDTLLLMTASQGFLFPTFNTRSPGGKLFAWTIWASVLTLRADCSLVTLITRKVPGSESVQVIYNFSDDILDVERFAQVLLS